MNDSVNPNTIVGEIIEDVPEAREVLASHGVEFVEDDEELPLYELCDLYDLDVGDVLADIQSVLGGGDR